MTRVFVSHSTSDQAFFIAHLKPLFARCGYTAWASGTDVRAAADWEQQIRRALAAADWFIVLLSPAAVSSEWVQAEIHWALENKRDRVIPVMIDPCRPSDAHLRLGTIQYIDFTTDPAGACDRLMGLMQGNTEDVPGARPTPGLAPEQTNIIATKRRLATLDLWIELPNGLTHERTLTINNWAVIGRAVDAHLRIDDDCVSRRHARIAVLPAPAGKRLTLTDLQSANGTFLNEGPVHADHPLSVGDLIEVGNTRLRLRRLA